MFQSEEGTVEFLELHVNEACAMFERVVSGRQARELERREHEEREREEQEQAFRDQRAREREEAERATWVGQDGNNGQPGEDEATADMPSQVPVNDGQRHHVQESPGWLCEHYQRRCKVRFPCCSVFHHCHRRVLLVSVFVFVLLTPFPVQEHC